MTATAHPDIEVRRGRPRDESRTDEILGATLDLVAEVGLAGLSIDAIAARAGVGKATIYRRWPSKESLILDAWVTTVRPAPLPDTGNLRDDLSTFLAGLGRTMAESDMQKVFPQIIAAARVNPEVGAAYAAFVAERRAPMRAMLERAVERGEISSRVDLTAVHDLLISPLLYRWLISDAPIDDVLVDTIVDVVIAGLRPT